MRLIDADELAKKWIIAGPEPYNTDAVEVLDSIREAPTVDAVPVVRCRECKYHEDTSVTEYEHCCLLSKTVRYNDFCSYGERKGDADNG